MKYLVTEDANSWYQWRVELSSELPSSHRVICRLLVIESWMLSLYRCQATKFYCLLKQVTKQLKSTHTQTHKTSQQITETHHVQVPTSQFGKDITDVISNDSSLTFSLSSSLPG